MPCILAPAAETEHLVIFHRDQEVTEEITVQTGEEVTIRCSDIGK